MPKIKTPRKDWVIWASKDVEGLLKRCKTGEEQALIIVLFRFGCRISEALGLRKKDFWADDRALHVRIENLKNKKNPERHLVLNRRLAFVDLLIKYIDRLREPHSRLFTFPRQSAWKNLKRIDSKAWPHSFRHARATRFAWEGADILALVSWFAWSDTRMAQNYVKQSRKLIEPLSEID